MAKPLSADQLRTLLHYEPLTGVFTRKASVTRTDLIGKVCGTINPRGYICIYIGGVPRLAHRLAWLYTHGKWPTYNIDHIDGNPGNNAISNLRDVTQKMNIQNQRKPSINNKLGILGVSKTASGKRFVAFIKVGAKSRSLGTFDTPQDAHQAYIEAKRQFHEGATL